MYVVAGVTGHTGAATAEALRARGSAVRVLVRDAAKGEPWRRRGCEVAVADLADPATLARALEGAQGAYLLSPPNPSAADFVADRTALIDRIAEGVRRSGIPRVVFLSSVGAQHARGTGPIVTVRHAEQVLPGAAPSVTFLRAAYFLENWGAVVPLARSEGILPHFGPVDVPFAQVCARDVGDAVARALGAADAPRVIELAGREDWSAAQVAAALGALLGRAVRAVGAPVEGARGGLEQAGLPPEMARLYAELYAGIASGLIAFERPEAVTRGATPLADALRGIA